MKKFKKLLILCFIILIFLIIFLILIKNLSKNESLYKEDEKIADVSLDAIKDLGRVEGYSTFFSVEQMMQNYIMKVEFKNKKAIYGILDEKYISENIISQENILDYIVGIAQYAENVKIIDIYEQTNEENAIYYIDCILEKEHIGKNFYFILYEDKVNGTYSVRPIEKNEYESKKNIGKALEEVSKKLIQIK